MYEQGRVHHVGALPALEDQLCTWAQCGRLEASGIDIPDGWDRVDDAVSDYQNALAWSLVRDMAEGATV